nr:hypothetical protein B0A51_06743 [Rachicladosporium sp. CCFEE 5018]
MAAPTENMSALLLDAPDRTATIQTIPVPTPGPGELLIRVHAIALNPIDALYTFKPLGSSGRTVGSDFAGTVVSAAPYHDEKSPIPSFSPGDRVSGFLQGACSINDRPGAFADYLVCPADLVWRIPNSMSFEEASAISLCGLTAAQALFQRLGFVAPWDTAFKPATPAWEIYALIYGASTSVGLYAAQLLHLSAKHSNTTVHLLGTASPARFDLLRAKPYSYEHLVSYRSPDWPAQIRALTPGNRGVDIALDCISQASTVGQVSSTLRDGGKLAVLRSRAAGVWDASLVPAHIDPLYDAVWRGLGERVQYHSMVLEANAEMRQFSRAFYRWLSSGDGSKLQANPVRRMPGGLGKVVGDGFMLVGEGDAVKQAEGRKEEWMKPISGEKLVYSLV